MKHLPHTHRIAWCAAAALLATAASAHAQPAPGWKPPELWFVYVVLCVVFLGALLSMALIRAALACAKPKWSLADALSEETEVTFMAPDAAGRLTPQTDASGKPVMIVEMRASISRVIALMGMMVILLMFLGFGVFCLYSFALTGRMPESVGEIVKFLLAGLTLFAPYVVNKFSTVFQGLSPGR